MRYTESAEATCRDCSGRFLYRPEFFRERHLCRPTRCPDCRAIRRASRTAGAIVSYAPEHDRLHVRLDTGELVLGRVEDFGADPPEAVWVGMAVTCEVTPDLAPGHSLRRARRLEVVSEP